MRRPFSPASPARRCSRRSTLRPRWQAVRAMGVGTGEGGLGRVWARRTAQQPQALAGSPMLPSTPGLAIAPRCLWRRFGTARPRVRGPGCAVCTHARGACQMWRGGRTVRRKHDGPRCRGHGGQPRHRRQHAAAAGGRLGSEREGSTAGGQRLCRPVERCRTGRRAQGSSTGDSPHRRVRGRCSGRVRRQGAHRRVQASHGALAGAHWRRAATAGPMRATPLGSIGPWGCRGLPRSQTACQALCADKPQLCVDQRAAGKPRVKVVLRLHERR